MKSTQIELEIYRAYFFDYINTRFSILIYSELSVEDVLHVLSEIEDNISDMGFYYGFVLQENKRNFTLYEYSQSIRGSIVTLKGNIHQINGVITLYGKCYPTLDTTLLATIFLPFLLLSANASKDMFMSITLYLIASIIFISFLYITLLSLHRRMGIIRNIMSSISSWANLLNESGNSS